MTSKFNLSSLPLCRLRSSGVCILCILCLLLPLEARLALLQLFLRSFRCFVLFIAVSLEVESTTEEAGRACSRRGVGRGHGKGRGCCSDVLSKVLTLFVLECRLEFIEVKRIKKE